jgi:D-psicose/D-tagatose/L-ribulose 3-epimerase
MKIGMNLLLWTTHVSGVHYPLLQDIQRVGYDGVEVPVFEGSAKDYLDLGAYLRGINLSATAATAMSPEASPISSDAKVRQAAVDRLKWLLDRCVDVGAEVLCGPLHSPLGVFTGTGPTRDERLYGIDTFQKVLEHAAEAKVVLAVEYLNRFENYFLTTAKETYEWVSAIDNPSCGMMWDTFHAHIEEKSVAPALEAVAPRLVHVHLSENDRGTPGSGQVNWRDTFATLERISYDRWLVIEAFGRALPNLAAATRVWRDLSSDPTEVYTEGYRFVKQRLCRPDLIP